jgi:molybdopterin molybdotransferase
MTIVPSGCFASIGRLVPFEAARLTAIALARPIGRVEEVGLAEARGRTLARGVIAARSLPQFDQAAMDGYAISLAGRGGVPLLLPVAGETHAGDPPATLAPGTARHVMTGAALPKGADTVVMQEHVTLRGGLVQIPPDLPPNTHIRRAGEDIHQGMAVLQPGSLIGWPEIALLAALGVAKVLVVAPLRIAILTTGSELRVAGEDLAAGHIYDSNGPMLAALLASPSACVTTLAVDDDLDTVTAALDALADSADLVITTAGMADGDRDHVRAAVARVGGELEIVKVALKPGQPHAHGRLRGACFVGLPGNPQAAAFAALAFVRPMIAALQGAPLPDRVTARLGFAWMPRPGRTELQPVSLDRHDGRLTARRSGPEGSHRMKPMVGADAVAVIPGAKEPLAAGALVEVLPFDRADFLR